ncbi:protein kinase domain-containing protein [Paraburkholderia humisilvae]|nr:serine/threonine-protein kinase [Paraburkholderia humisilvae]
MSFGDKAALRRALEFYCTVPAHPALPLFLGVKKIGAKECLAMELVEGNTLGKVFERMRVEAKQHLASEQAQVRSILKFGRDLFDGLSHLEMYGRAHGDIRPENLILNRHGILKMINVGLQSNACGEAEGAGFAGTPRYMEPEIMRASLNADASKADVSAAADVLLHGLARFRTSQDYRSIVPGDEKPSGPRFRDEVLSAFDEPGWIIGMRAPSAESLLVPSEMFFGNRRSTIVDDLMNLVDEVLHTASNDRPSASIVAKVLGTIAEQHLSAGTTGDAAKRFGSSMEDVRKKGLALWATR